MAKFRIHHPMFGRPGRDYARRRKELEPLFKHDFPKIELHLQDLGRIAHDIQILQATPYRWCNSWRDDNAWRRWRVEAHSEHHRTFIDEDTEAFPEFIVTN
jgi:hypothetical protein